MIGGFVEILLSDWPKATYIAQRAFYFDPHKCLRQQTRIMEQVRELKNMDLRLFQYESLCQKQIDAEFEKRKEIERLEALCRLAERILDLQNVSFPV